MSNQYNVRATQSFVNFAQNELLNKFWSLIPLRMVYNTQKIYDAKNDPKNSTENT